MILSKRAICLFVILLVISCKKDEFTNADSKMLALFNPDSLNDLQGAKKEKYLDSLCTFLKVRSNDSICRNFYFKLSTQYYYNNNFEKSLSVSLKVLKLSEQADDKAAIAKSLYYIGDSYENMKRDSAYYYYLKAEKLYYTLSDSNNQARMLFNKACLLFYDGNYIECEVEISKALKLLKESSDYQLFYSCNTLMGNCLEKLLNYDKALSYHQQALNAVEKMRLTDIDKRNVNNNTIASIINICNLHDLKGEYSKSIKKLQALLTNDLLENSSVLYANVLSNLAYSRMKNGDYTNVYPMFAKSLEIVTHSGNESDVLYKKIHIGEYFLARKDTANAITLLREANQLAMDIRNGNEILISLKLLSELDKKNSLFFANQYIKISDSINSIQKNVHQKYARIEYETSRIEDENKVLTKKNFYVLIVSFLLILFLVLIFGIKYFNFKTKEVRFLKNQQKAREEIYLLITEQHEKINEAKELEKARIAKELHDGVMNKIYGIRMNLGFYNSKTESEIIDKRKSYIFDLQKVENEIRSISHDLNKSTLFDGNDFNVLILGLLQDQNNIGVTKFDYVFDSHFQWNNVEYIYKINIYRIIQEAVLNANKYSNAQTCQIKIQKENDFLKISIVDDGQGFDLKNVKYGIGISNMRERTDSLNGYFNIQSKTNLGTVIEVIIKIS